MIQINFSSSSLWCVSRSFLHSIRKIVWWLDEKSGKNIRRRDFPFFFPRGGLICALCAARGPAPPASYSLRRSLVYWLVVSLRSLPLVLLPSLSFNLFFFTVYIYMGNDRFMVPYRFHSWRRRETSFSFLIHPLTNRLNNEIEIDKKPKWSRWIEGNKPFKNVYPPIYV